MIWAANKQCAGMLEEGENEDDKWIIVTGRGKTKTLLKPKLKLTLHNNPTRYNMNPVGFYSRNRTESTLHHKHNIHKHHHHGGAVCPSYGVESMDTPDRTCRPSSEGVGREGGRSE